MSLILERMFDLMSTLGRYIQSLYIVYAKWAFIWCMLYHLVVIIISVRVAIFNSRLSKQRFFFIHNANFCNMQMPLNRSDNVNNPKVRIC